MKIYNLSPAINFLAISERSYCNKNLDDSKCLENHFDALDFALWYDESLLTTALPMSLPAFSYIIEAIDNGYISCNKLKNKNFRLACLIYSKFVNCDKERLSKIREDFLKDNPNFFNSEDIKEEKIDYDSLFNDYNHSKCNKRLFPYFYGNGVAKTLISELITRQFICCEEYKNITNIIYICKDNFDYHGIEKNGMTSKHFMKLEGEKFPFVYFKEDFSNVSNSKYIRFEMFENSLSLLQYLSRNEIHEDILYCSLHSKNYDLESIENLKKVFGDLPLHFNFEDSKYKDNKKEETIEKEEIEENKDYFYSKEELIEMKENDSFDNDKFYRCGGIKKYEFEDILNLKQRKTKEGLLYFDPPTDDEESERVDVYGYTEELPF